MARIKVQRGMGRGRNGLRGAGPGPFGPLANGTGKGTGRVGGLRRNKNTGPCTKGGPGYGKGEGRGKGTGRAK